MRCFSLDEVLLGEHEDQIADGVPGASQQPGPGVERLRLLDVPAHQLRVEPRDELRVAHRQVDLHRVAQAGVVEVGGADRHPAPVDDADLGVHVVLGVVAQRDPVLLQPRPAADEVVVATVEDAGELARDLARRQKGGDDPTAGSII